MKVLYAVSEAFPFVKNGGLGDVAYAFPQKVWEQGEDIRLILPLYDVIPERYRDRMELMTNFTLNLALDTYYCGLYRLELEGRTSYFVENHKFFTRGKLYGCSDDDSRFAFFCKAVVESLRFLEWTPDVIHCNDWQTALILFYLEDARLHNRSFPKIRTVFTIHNVEQQGDFSYDTLTDVFGLSGVLFSSGTLEMQGKVNLMKGAVSLADCVTTVSQTYAKELMCQTGPGEIGEVLGGRHIIGIRNGLHQALNPGDAKTVHHPYDENTVAEKVENKLWMQERLGLVKCESAPLFGCLSRLMQRKGFELVLAVMPELLRNGAQLVVVGDGDREIAGAIRTLKEEFPQQVELLPYSEENSETLFSGADVFLMPSAVEPCGTSQLQAMRYGTVPVVHATGGLKDTVKHFDAENPEGYGFVFAQYSEEGLMEAIRQALCTYGDKMVWESMQKRCMQQIFSWDEPAEEYRKLYASILK